MDNKKVGQGQSGGQEKQGQGQTGGQSGGQFEEQIGSERTGGNRSDDQVREDKNVRE